MNPVFKLSFVHSLGTGALNVFGGRKEFVRWVWKSGENDSDEL